MSSFAIDQLTTVCGSHPGPKPLFSSALDFTITPGVVHRPPLQNGLYAQREVPATVHPRLEHPKEPQRKAFWVRPQPLKCVFFGIPPISGIISRGRWLGGGSQPWGSPSDLTAKSSWPRCRPMVHSVPLGTCRLSGGSGVEARRPWL